uniref:Zf-LYAR domain-containing protein n=1 Tax=Schistosoma mansoni TaxID=6183 RepID=A0A5K4ET66_SCHMA
MQYKIIYRTYKTSVLSPQECMTKKEFKAKLLGVIQGSEYFIFSPCDGMISMVSDDLVTESVPRVNPDPDISLIICQNDKPHYSESLKKLLINTINDAGGRISLKKLVKRASSHVLNSNDQKEVSLTKEEVKSKIVEKSIKVSL